MVGRPSCLVFGTRGPDGEPSQAYRTLFLQELLRRGVLGQSFVVSAAHTDDDLQITVDAVRRGAAGLPGGPRARRRHRLLPRATGGAGSAGALRAATGGPRPAVRSSEGNGGIK